MNNDDRAVLSKVSDNLRYLGDVIDKLVASRPGGPPPQVAKIVEGIQRRQLQIANVETIDQMTPLEPPPIPKSIRPDPANPTADVPVWKPTPEEEAQGQIWRINAALEMLGIRILPGGNVEVAWDVFAAAIGQAQAEELSVILEELYGG